MQIASAGTSNTNVEMDETNGFKRFRHGVTAWLLNHRRIGGGWYISILRHLHVVVSTSDDLMTRDQRRDIAEACTLAYTVHYALRLPLPKNDAGMYNANIKRLLLKLTIDICSPHSLSRCNSTKYHWPLQWGSTRIQIGRAAMEKSLERKLGDTHGKPNFRFTNSKGNKEVHHIH